MLQQLRNVWNSRRDRGASQRPDARLCVEELEGRVVPSLFGPGPLVHGGGNAALADVRSDLSSLTKALGNSATSAISKDITTVQGDLKALATDFAAGNSVTKDLTTLTTDLSTLTKALNTLTLTSRAQRLVKDLTSDVNNLGTALTQSGGHGRGGDSDDGDDQGERGDRGRGDDHGGALGNFVGNIAQALDIRTDIAAVNSAVTSLTTALGDIATTDPIKTDLSNVTADLSTIQTNLTSGTPIDLTALNKDVGTLTTDLGNVSGGIPSAAQTQLNTLNGVLTDVTNDLTQFTNRLQAEVTGAQNSLTQLTNLLGSNVSSTVTGDLKALDTALTTLATDLTNGTPLTSDLTTALQDELTLVNDLGTSLPRGARGTLTSIASDLLGLGVASLL